MPTAPSRTLLQIVNAAQGELGLPQTTTVVNNPDATTIQMFNLANRALDMLRREHPTGWQVCQFEYEIVVNTPIITTGNLGINSPVITSIAAGTAGITANYWTVSGNSIPQAARVLSVDSVSQVTMTMESATTSAISNAALTFAQDTYPMPTDYDWTQNRTHWDRTNRWELLGPDSPQMDQWHRSGIVATGPRRHWRQLGNLANQWRIWPAPAEIANPLQLVFEYLSVNCVSVHGSASSFAQFFANDDDKPLLDSQAIIEAVKWLFFEIKGFNVAAMQGRWVDYVQRLIARDGAAPTLNLVKRVNPIFISPANVQDGFYPGPVGPNMN